MYADVSAGDCLEKCLNIFEGWKIAVSENV
jgi:hypothetical protein